MSVRCAVCARDVGKARGGLLCLLCGRSYDRARNKDITIAGAIAWAAARARHFEARRRTDSDQKKDEA